MKLTATIFVVLLVLDVSLSEKMWQLILPVSEVHNHPQFNSRCRTKLSLQKKIAIQATF